MNTDDAEVLEQALNDAMDKVEQHVTVFASEKHRKARERGRDSRGLKLNDSDQYFWNHHS